MPFEKSPGKFPSLTEEFFETFWSEVKKNIFILRITLF